MPVRAVLFDAVGTLIHADPPVAAAYAAAAKRVGIRIDETLILARFRAAFARQEEIDRLRGRATSLEREIERWREIVADVFEEAAPSLELRHEIFADLWRHFARPESWRVDPEAGACWQALAARGLIVAVASNFDDRLVEIARQLAPLDRAERLFVSAQIGYRKPAREFFRFIERDLGLAPAELVSLGDDPANDYHGALSAGWQAILFDPSAARRCESTPAAISSLSELLDRL